MTFIARFVRFRRQARASADVETGGARDAYADVAARGDAALFAMTQKFDRVDLGTIGMAGGRRELGGGGPKACD